MSLFLHRPLAIRPSAVRALSTTAPRLTSLQIERNDREALLDTVPPYPYGPAQWYKQSDRGLYGGQRIQFGNNIGPKFETKTRRSWHPNVFRKRLYSRALDRYVQIKVSTRVMRTIDKLGGLDEYLLGGKEGRIKELGVSGWWLRWAIMQTPEVRSRFVDQRQLLGLPAGGIEAEIEEPEVPESVEALDETAGEELVETTLTQQQRLKFRVGPRTHLYYDSGKWHRAAPDRESLFKRSIRKNDPSYKEFHQDQTAIMLKAFDAATQDHDLSPLEKSSLRQRMRNEVDKSAERIVEKLWEANRAEVAIRRLRVQWKHKLKARRATRAEVRAIKRREKKAQALTKKILVS